MSDKHSYEYVKKSIENGGFTLISTEYKNVKEKLEVMYPYGHISLKTFHGWRNGNRCAECCGNKKHNYENIKQLIESEKFTLISTEYKNSREKLEIMCPYGHISLKTFHGWMLGKRCFECVSYDNSENCLSDIISDLFQLEFKKQRPDWLINMTIYCRKHYKFKNECGCKITKNRLELDLYNEELKLAFEYNGRQHIKYVSKFHTNIDGFYYTVKRDVHKELVCKNKGITLIQVPHIYTHNKPDEMKKYVIQQLTNHSIFY